MRTPGSNPSDPAPAAQRWRTRGPLAALGGLFVGALTVRPDPISGIIGALCLLMAWVWLTLPADHRPGHRHPHLRKAARRPRVIAWRTRDGWLPAARAPALWVLVFGGLLGLGALIGVFAGSRTLWWTLFAPAMLLAAAGIVDVVLLMVFGFWWVMVPMILLMGAFPFFVEGAARPTVIGLLFTLASLWLADLARALYSGRAAP